MDESTKRCEEAAGHNATLTITNPPRLRTTLPPPGVPLRRVEEQQIAHSKGRPPPGTLSMPNIREAVIAASCEDSEEDSTPLETVLHEAQRSGARDKRGAPPLLSPGRKPPSKQLSSGLKSERKGHKRLDGTEAERSHIYYAE